jgi:hypothetical protein
MLVLLLCVYIGISHLSNPAYWGFFGGVNLGIHEFGHLLFGVGGKFISVLGGTIAQLSLPIICAVAFLWQRDYFAICFCGVWFSSSMYNVAWYLADARAQQIPLLGGNAVTHDWHYLLSQMHILPWDKTIALILRVFAFMIMWGSIFLGAWMIWLMVKPRTGRGA